MLKGGQFLIACAIAGVSTIGVVGAYSAYENRDMGIEYVLTVGDETQEELSFALTDMYPGSECSYVVRIKPTEEADYSLAVSFAGEGALAPFVDVTLTQNGEELLSATLEECLKGNKRSLNAITSSQPQEIVLTYSMGLDVGDEAQGAEADFRIVFTTKEVE